MNIKQYDKIQTVLYKAKSIVLAVMCVPDSSHDEIEGALWAAKDLIGEAEGLLKATVQPERARSEGK